MIPIKIMHLIRLRAERSAREILAAVLEGASWREIRGRRSNGIILDEANWRFVASVPPRRRKNDLPKVRKGLLKPSLEPGPAG